MGQFIGTLELTPLDSDNGRDWREDSVASYQASNGVIVTTVVGDITDLASIPRPLWIFWPPEGLWTVPAVFHDEGYQRQKYTRLQYDQMLFEAMTDKGVDWFTRHVIFAGVRVGGWVAWNQHAKENKLNPPQTQNFTNS